VPEHFDYFHEMILYDEISRCGNAAGKAHPSLFPFTRAADSCQ
jgi:hypothetical protein